MKVSTVLRVLAMLPVTTATPKRSFSILRRLKNNLKIRMEQERLNASLSIYPRIGLTEEEIHQEFYKKPRRLKMY